MEANSDEIYRQKRELEMMRVRSYRNIGFSSIMAKSYIFPYRTEILPMVSR